MTSLSTMKEPVSSIISELREMMKCPGFRFRPTEEEIICFHLKRKVIGRRPWRTVIGDVDLYSLEPGELPSHSILQGGDMEYYFFTALDKKYGHGSRTNRATPDGYWKTTGKDHSIYLGPRLVGARKTLVYHFGRAPHGERTNWVMHEFRLEGELVAIHPSAEEIFVCCRIFEKSGAGPKNGEQYGAPFVEEDWEDELFLSKVPMIENNDGSSGSGGHDDSNVQPDGQVQISSMLHVAQMDQPVTGSGSDLDHVKNPGNLELQNVSHVPQPYFDNLQFPGGQNLVEDTNENANNFTGSSSHSDHVELPGNFDPQNVVHVPQPCFDGPDFPGGLDFVEDINENANNLNEEAVTEARMLNENYVEANDFGAVAEQNSFSYYPREIVDADPIFYDASSNHDDLHMGHSHILELNDLVDELPTMTYSSGEDLVDEYLNNFGEADANLEQYLAFLDSVSPSPSTLEPVVVDPTIQTPEAPKDSATEGASSSKRKATSFYDAAENKHADMGDNGDMDGSWGKSWTKRLHGMLGSIPSPPAFAAEEPLKGNVKFVGQSSGTPLPGSVHVEAGMFYVSGFTVASASPKVWPLQKADAYLLGYSTEHLVSNSASIPEKARLAMLRSGFFLCSLWVLLAVSYKVGLFVCAR